MQWNVTPIPGHSKTWWMVNSENCPKKPIPAVSWQKFHPGHRVFSHMTKQNLCRGGHRSHPAMNWMKWDSSRLMFHQIICILQKFPHTKTSKHPPNPHPVLYLGLCWGYNYYVVYMSYTLIICPFDLKSNVSEKSKRCQMWSTKIWITSSKMWTGLL